MRRIALALAGLALVALGLVIPAPARAVPAASPHSVPTTAQDPSLLWTWHVTVKATGEQLTIEGKRAEDGSVKLIHTPGYILEVQSGGKTTNIYRKEDNSHVAGVWLINKPNQICIANYPWMAEVYTTYPDTAA